MAMGMMMMGSSSMSSSAMVAVEKATSDLLIGPDWTMNMDICDSVNTHRWQAKDVVKAVKKRLQHKSPKVQLLALTLLETMVKNCGDYVHFQIFEKNILGEMVKIVKKKTDMHVRDKILVLLDSWQEAFGGPGGKYPQYYWAYEELRRFGVEFPPRSLDAAPIITPPSSTSTLRITQPGYGMPSNSTRRLDETMAAEIEGLSLSSLESMQNIMDLLSDMLEAVNPGDREVVKDEIIVDLADRCRSNQKKLIHMLTTTADEALLLRGLELNENLQNLLAKHDAIASGSPLPKQGGSLSPKPSEASSSDTKRAEVSDQTPIHKPISPASNVARGKIDEEEEEEDEFAQLARRHSKVDSSPTQSLHGASGDLVSVETSRSLSTETSNANPAPCNALVLADPPAAVRATKEQDMIDLLSTALTITSNPSQLETSHTPPASEQRDPQTPASSSSDSYAYGPQSYPVNQVQVPFNNYVVPWAQPQPQHQLQPSSQTQFQPQDQQRMQVQSQAQHQVRAQSQIQQQMPVHSQGQHQMRAPSQTQQQMPIHSQGQHQMQAQSQQFSFNQQQSRVQSQIQPPSQPHPQLQYPQYSTAYPPPPWAATPGYATGQSMYSIPQSNGNASYTSAQGARPQYPYNPVPARGSNGSIMNGAPTASSAPRNSTTPAGHKAFIPSYRLFEDLNVLGNADGRYKMSSGTSPSLSGTSSQGMVGGQK